MINASWGGSGVDPVIAAAIQYADEYGVIIVAAAGNAGTNNDNMSTWFSPASYSVDYPNLIAVAATDDHRQPGLRLLRIMVSNRCRSPRQVRASTACP